jgi:hypothetical protein
VLYSIVIAAAGSPNDLLDAAEPIYAAVIISNDPALESF